jgi:hypothetical protein
MVGLTAVLILIAWFLLAPPRCWLNLTKPVDLTESRWSDKQAETILVPSG